MQGRHEPRDRSSNQYPHNMNGTGRQRAIPRRPPNMTRIDQPPVKSRVARPQREAPRHTSFPRRLLFWGFIFVVAGALACGIGYAAVNFFAATNATAGQLSRPLTFLQLFLV